MEGGKIRRRPSSAPPAASKCLSGFKDSIAKSITRWDSVPQYVTRNRSSSKGEVSTLRSFCEFAILSVDLLIQVSVYLSYEASMIEVSPLTCHRASGHRYIGVSYAQLPFKPCLASSVAFWPTNRTTDHPSAIRPRDLCGSVSPTLPRRSVRNRIHMSPQMTPLPLRLSL